MAPQVDNIILSQEVNPTQLVNNDFLRQGVKGVRCSYMGQYAQVQGLLTVPQVLAVRTIRGRLNNDEILGTLEVYDNGALNVFVHRGSAPNVCTYFIYRENVDPSTIVNTDRHHT